MPAKSTAANKMPKFKSEAEEADWYHTPEGRLYAFRKMQEGIRKGVITVEEKLTPAEATRILRNSDGKMVRFKKGLKIRRTDPAVLNKLLEEARTSMTKAISIRLPVGDLEQAQQIAKKEGIGYQTVLKRAIREGLKRAG